MIGFRDGLKKPNYWFFISFNSAELNILDSLFLSILFIEMRKNGVVVNHPKHPFWVLLKPYTNSTQITFSDSVRFSLLNTLSN